MKCYYQESKNILILDVFDYRNGGSSLVIVDNETGGMINWIDSKVKNIFLFHVRMATLSITMEMCLISMKIMIGFCLISYRSHEEWKKYSSLNRNSIF